MERFVGIEEARGSLGRLVEEVATSGEHIAFTKRGRALAVLVSRDEYAQLKQIANERAREELGRLLTGARQRVKAAGLDPSVIEQAIAAARQLT
jgi:prevent-host-death family protein